MASLRGSTTLWDAATVNPADSSTLKSGIAVPGPGTSVVIYIDSDQGATFDIEVAVNPTGTEAGRNAVDDSDPDGGLTWFKYDGGTGLTVTGGTPVAFDLSPFGPQLFRLVRTDSGTSATVTAYSTAIGVN